MPEPNQSENDFDTIHGTSLTDPSKPLILYWDKKKTSDFDKKEQSRFLLINILLFSISFFLAFFAWISQHFLPVFVAVPFALMTFITSIMLLKTSIYFLYWKFFSCKKNLKLFMKPIVEIRVKGIGVHSPSQNFDLIPWAAIKEVRAESIYKQRFLRIIPKDPEYLLSLESDAQKKPGSPEEVSSQLATAIKIRNKKLFSCFLPKELKEVSIDVPEAWMPFGADEVANFVNIRLSAYRNSS